ncbi:hypothetical protein DL764_003676 [Monosporascus ibericus]|uniref:TatD DNase n=1 Tax=Monosporascus ibericus TaxID=155417 RepID=A0A4Q4TFL1_9PEZI|nr:hypothetical protein DL764_003676 [Monosporascus ibericus]
MAAESASLTGAAAPVTYKPRYVDIGINLADPIFRGIYHGTRRHPDDLGAVISRAKEVGCRKLIVTGSDFKSSRDALEIAKEYPGTVYTTAGIHPCSSAIFGAAHAQRDSDGHTPPCDPDPSQPASEDDEPDAAKTASIIAELEAIVAEGRAQRHPSPLVALGEFGLDYDRLHYCPRRLQLHSFAAQLELALKLDPPLPLFLHSRAAHGDFVGLLRAKLGARLEGLRGRGAVVHSFTGTAAELRELLDLGLYVGVNGCSFKTAENCAVVREMDLSRLMLETDGPWCEIRPSHEGWKYLIEPKTPATAASDAGADSTANSTPSTQIQTPASTSGTSTPASTSASGNPPKQLHQGSKKKKPQKKVPEVPERFPSVKKEKWTEGAMVKSRNEPCTIERVAKVVAGIKGVSVEEACETAWRNTVAVFDLGEVEGQ